MSLITLGVSDLQRAVAFYRDGLGGPESEVGGGEVAFFKTGVVVIALFPRTSFASDAGVDVDGVEHEGFARISLAHNVAEEEQVDAVLAEAAEAGATIVKEAQEIFFGRHGFFADPDGFLWEVAWNPSRWQLTAASSCLTEHLVAEALISENTFKANFADLMHSEVRIAPVQPL